MKKNIIYTISLIFTSLFTGCEHNKELENVPVKQQDIQFEVFHPDQQTKPLARLTETAFETNDIIGLYITENGEMIQPGGNYITNIPLTYNGNRWNPNKPIYWNNGTYNVYAYYPYVSPIISTEDTAFSVALDQNTPSTENAPSGYASSDLLWACSSNLSASDSPVQLKFRHCMSKLLIRVIKGEDYEGDELPQNAEVFIHNTVPSGTVDLNVGIVTKDRFKREQTIKAKVNGNGSYSAILIPQRIETKRPLIEVIMNGVSYMMESKFIFKPGIQHTVSLIISKNPEQVKIEIGGEIEDWEPES